MGFYDHYAMRSRNRIGLKTKQYQNKHIFELGLNTPTPKILELGPGDGYIAALCKENNYEYLGIEGSESVANKLISQGYNIRKGFVPPIPDDIGSFDICYMLHIIEHLPDMDAAIKTVTDIRSRLNDNGNLIVACPDYMRWGAHFYDCDYTHSLPFTRRRLKRLLINEGFEIKYSSIYTGPVFGYWGLPLYWLVKLIYPLFINDVLSMLSKNDIFNRGFLTMLPNIIMVARKKKID